MIEYNPYGDQIFDDPYPVYKQLRDDDPAHYMEEFNAYFVTRFEDIWKLGPNFKNLSVSQGTTPDHLLIHTIPNTLSFSGMDPPKHSKHRSTLNQWFLPAAAADLERTLRPVAAKLAEELAERGEGDLARDYAAQIAVRGAMITAGLPLDIIDQGLEWVNGIFMREEGHRGQTKEGMKGSTEMFHWLVEYTKEMRKNPEKASGVLQTMLGQEIDGETANDHLIASTLSMILVGGSDTFPKAFSATLKRLWENPEQRRMVVDDPSLSLDAFLEALRMDTPTQMLGRLCTKEFELHGKKVQPGSGVLFCWAAANRDDREFENPDDYQLLRRPKRMLAFGHGVHMCIGHHIAKMEARMGLEELLKRVPEYELRMDEAVRLRTEFVQGWMELPATLPS